jgi:hypothetical protein
MNKGKVCYKKKIKKKFCSCAANDSQQDSSSDVGGMFLSLASQTHTTAATNVTSRSWTTVSKGSLSTTAISKGPLSTTAVSKGPLSDTEEDDEFAIIEEEEKVFRPAQAARWDLCLKNKK